MYDVTPPGDPAARAALPEALARAAERLTTDLSREGYAVTSELRLRDVVPGEHRTEYTGPSLRLDVEDLTDPERTLALRLYSGGASPRKRHGSVVVVTGWGDHDDPPSFWLADAARRVRELGAVEHPAPVPNREVAAALTDAARGPLAAVTGDRDALVSVFPAYAEPLADVSEEVFELVGAAFPLSTTTLEEFRRGALTLADLASGAPLEWALRRAAERVS